MARTLLALTLLVAFGAPAFAADGTDCSIKASPALLALPELAKQLEWHVFAEALHGMKNDAQSLSQRYVTDWRPRAERLLKEFCTPYQQALSSYESSLRAYSTGCQKNKPGCRERYTALLRDLEGVKTKYTAMNEQFAGLDREMLAMETQAATLATEAKATVSDLSHAFAHLAAFRAATAKQTSMPACRAWIALTGKLTQATAANPDKMADAMAQALGCGAKAAGSKACVAPAPAGFANTGFKPLLNGVADPVSHLTAFFLAGYTLGANPLFEVGGEKFMEAGGGARVKVSAGEYAAGKVAVDLGIQARKDRRIFADLARRLGDFCQ
ncbi:MAG TPA: hypothetical protein VL588_08150 [Bdellovibrionota bacterium]|nr:hypothetical protein [Bdellovibrionota bacterium]